MEYYSEDLCHSQDIKAARHSGDPVIWCKEDYAATARYRTRLATDKFNRWTEKWCVAVNKKRFSTALFTLSPNKGFPFGWNPVEQR